MARDKEVNKMAIPGFIREEIMVYKTSEQYKMTGAVEALAGSAEVVPQALICTSFNKCVGPVCLSARCCLIPPGCCVSIRIAGVTVFSRCFP